MDGDDSADYEGLDFIIPDLEEEFEVTEGATFKGHAGPVRDLIRLN